MSKSKNFLFTSFTTVDNELVHPTFTDDMLYLIYQVEECPLTSKHHIQGYVIFKHPIRISNAQDKLRLGSIHLDIRKGTHQQAKDYCSKEDTQVVGPKSFGVEPVGQGRRTDLAIPAQEILAGKRIRDIANDHPVEYIKYHKGLNALRLTQLKPYVGVKNVVIYYGTTGSGKTRAVMDEFKDNVFVWPDNDTKWADNYDGEECILFDEFDGNLPINFIKRITDRYICPMQVKGGMTTCASKNIYFTSQHHPSRWWGGFTCSDEDRAAIKRRITRIEEFTLVMGETKREVVFWD